MMQLPIIKSISDIRKNSKRILEQVQKKNDVVLITRPKRARIADTVDFIDNDSLIWKR